MEYVKDTFYPKDSIVTYRNALFKALEDTKDHPMLGRWLKVPSSSVDPFKMPLNDTTLLGNRKQKVSKPLSKVSSEPVEYKTGTMYVVGQRVLYKGKIYKAKFSTSVELTNKNIWEEEVPFVPEDSSEPFTEEPIQEVTQEEPIEEPAIEEPENNIVYIPVEGIAGLDGQDGTDGLDGRDGQDGLDGRDGEQGPQGIQGEQGFTGDTGPRGLVGPKGDKGDTGLGGIQGPRGFDGLQGERGIEGKKGKDGKDGRDAPYFEIGSGTGRLRARIAAVEPRVLPIGGTLGQVLAKKSDSNFDTQWIDQTGGGSSTWGSITGTLSNQTDLQAALDAKANTTDLVNYVPYTGATSDVNLGEFNFNAKNITINGGNNLGLSLDVAGSVGADYYFVSTFGQVVDNNANFHAHSFNLDSATANTLAGWDGSNNLISLNTGTYPNLTELSYLKDTTSSVQTQLDSKASVVSLAAYELLSNKVISISGSSTNVEYPSAKLLYDQLLLKQDALSGTGFVKISGTTISYDNSTYLTTSSAASTYVPQTTMVNGHALSSNVTVTQSDVGLGNVVNLDTSTTVNIIDSTDKRFVTDANLVTLSNTSNTNTGDQVFQTNGTPNTLQSILNLIQGTNISLTPDGSGGVTIDGASTTGFVPYTGATSDVDLGTHTLLAANLKISTQAVFGTSLLGNSIVTIESGSTSKAQLLFNGTPLSTISTAATSGIVNGGMFYDATGVSATADFWGVDSATARRFIRTGTSTALTSGIMPIATTSGRLIDGPLSVSGSGLLSNRRFVTIAATTAAASINIQTGVAPTTGLANGDIWVNSNHLFMRLNGVTQQIDQQVTLTTTGTSGAATYTSGTLNIPQYQAAGTYVTAIGITTANGVSGLSSGGTTPNLTISLGAITPTSVNGIVFSGASTPTLAVTGTTTVSGTNTGDQTNITGNAGTATALQNARSIGGVSFNGTANIVPQTIESANEATDTTCFPLFITASGTQQLQPKNNTGLTYNSNTNNFGCTTFTGALVGNADTATVTTSVAITDDTTTNATVFPTWVTANTGNPPLKVTSTKYSFNPSTGLLSLGGSFTSTGDGHFNGDISSGAIAGAGVAGVYVIRNANQLRVGSSASKFFNIDVQAGTIVLTAAGVTTPCFAFQQPVLSVLDGYLNFNTNVGSGGYGFRDNSSATGTMQYKNSGGSWNDFVSDTAYASSWNGVTLTAPSKNAVFDAMEMRATGGAQALTSNFTTSSTTAVSTNLSFPIAANETWSVVITGTASKATTATGLKVGIGAPVGATIKGMQQSGGTTLAIALTNSLITAINTLGVTFNLATNVEVCFRMEFQVTNGSTAGSIVLQGATVTSNVATIYAGTRMEYTMGTLV